jgi:hypothetical protein
MNCEMGWQAFEKSIAAIYSANRQDETKTAIVSTALSTGMTFRFNQDLRKVFESGDSIMINYRFKKLLEGKLEVQQLHLAVDFEPLSSLDIELKSTSATKLNLKDLQKRNKEEEKLKEVISETRKSDDPLAGKDVRLLFSGKLILSPIKGKNISLLAPGDRVRVIITDKSTKAAKIAQAFNAFDETKGSILPITGRVVSNRFFPKSGFEFYVVISKGINLKILEDQENIKVAIPEDAPGKGSQSEAEGAKIKPVIIWTCLAGLVIAGIIFMLFM